jgi:putative hydrolase of the HAD superfamily
MRRDYPLKHINALIFDLGGVITFPQNTDRVRDMIGVFGNGLSMPGFLEIYFRHRLEYDRGAIDAARYWKLVAGEAGRPLASQALERLEALDIASWFNINPASLAFIREMKPKVKRLGLLSNINHEGARHLRTGYDWLGLFDQLVLSCDHLVVKPEKEIFEICLDRLGVEPEACLFLDDSAANIEGCRLLGMHGLQFTGIEDARRRLAGEYSFGA